VEMAGALAEFRRHVVPRDYRHVEPHAVRLVLLEAGPELLSPFAPRLRERARRDLLERGVEVRTGATVTRITPDRVELASGATIGRSRAVAMIGRLQVGGRLAWVLWLVVHLVMLIGFRNRLVVLVNWAWNYLTYDFGLRAIVGADPEATAAVAPAADAGRQRAAGGSS